MQDIEAAPTQASIAVSGPSGPSSFAPNGFVPKREVPQRVVNIQEPSVYFPSLPATKQPAEMVQILRTRCKQIGISLFFKDNASVRSLGFTSAIGGEGKTFLARLTAEVMAEEGTFRVTLLECNWDKPTLGLAYNLPPGPGLSEWLLGRCPLEAIRRRVTGTLTVIPSGDTNYNVTQLLQKLQQRSIHSVLTDPNEILIVDLPATATTVYGPLAAQLPDLLILVVRMGVTPESQVAEACHSLRDSHVYGVIFNQVASRIPHWLQKIL